MLGEYDSFTGTFRELARFILPLTPFRFNHLLKKNWQLYCIYRGNPEHSMESFTNYLKKEAIKVYLKTNFHYRVFQRDPQYAEVFLSILRLNE